MAMKNKQHQFAMVPSAEIQRSVFNRSCGTKTTFEPGLLIPVFADEALPGDTMNMKAGMVCRLSTLLHPIMDNVYVDLFFFSVPIRLIWDNWEKFNGAQDDPGDSTDFTIPVMTAPAATGYEEETVQDYLGIPTLVASLEHSALFNRAYNLIWNEWFRAQELQNSVVVDKDDGPDTSTDYTTVLPRGKRHDYFTSCLTAPQRGDAVTMSLGDTAPLQTTGDGIPSFSNDSGTTVVSLRGTSGSAITNWSLSPATTANMAWEDPKLEVDLSSATAATINSLRQAVQLQRLLERDARGGTRYTEILRSHFQVISPDFRVQRPEYLGGGTIPMIMRQVERTTGGTTTGDLGAYGIIQDYGKGFTHSFTEHCIVLGLVSARADLNYQQGLHRMFSRSTRFDFYWPALAHIGEQSVLNKEIYADNSANDDLVFGYQARYDEYRYKPSICTAGMRSNYDPGTLDSWHLAQDFDSLPVLGSDFIEEDPPISRVLGVPTGNSFLMDISFDFRHARPMPTFGVPGLIDHF